LHNIILKHNDIVDDDILFVGHHDEGRRQQISKQVVSSEVDKGCYNKTVGSYTGL
jgi:hypothetical protein